MKEGKLSEAVLARSVLKQLHTRRPEALTCPGVGQDGAVVRAEGDTAYAVSTMALVSPVRVPLAVYTACNNIACCGAGPLGLLVSLLLPTAANEQILRDIMGEIESICAAEEIQVLTGHTEVTPGVLEPVLTVTAVGAICAGWQEPMAEPGMELLVTNGAGLAGSAVLVQERGEELKSRFAQPFLDRVKPELSVRGAAEAAGGVLMHDVSQGGIYAALWELAERFHVGLEVDLKKIPIRQETVEICEFFGLNPYKLLSTGCLLLAAHDGGGIVRAIRRAGGTAAVIGRLTEGSDRLLFVGEERRYLETAQTDELYKIIRS